MLTITLTITKNTLRDAIEMLAEQRWPWWRHFRWRDQLDEPPSLVVEHEHETDETTATTLVNAHEWARAVSLLQQHRPAAIGRIAAGTADADDVDVMLQFAVFGRVVFA